MHHTSNNNVVDELDILIKDMEFDIIGLYQDHDHAVELSHKDGIFYVRLDGANLYSGDDGAEATSTFYEQIAQIEDDAENHRDPSFASLREILQARNDHVREMLAAMGHERLASSLDGIDLTKEFNMESFRNIIQKNMTTLDVLNFANYRPSEEENKECHTCIFFAAGGYCTKLDLPVKEEMMCDFFKSLPMAEKNEEWAHVSHQSWEEAEHEEEHEHAGDMQKNVSTDLLYSTDQDLETPANFREDSRKPNIIMREFIPENGNKGFQVLAKSDDDSITEVQLINNDGNWGVFTKQRDYSDLGDPFQSVGEPNAPKKIKNEEESEFTYDEEGNATVVKDGGVDKASEQSAALYGGGQKAGGPERWGQSHSDKTVLYGDGTLDSNGDPIFTHVSHNRGKKGSWIPIQNPETEDLGEKFGVPPKFRGETAPSGGEPDPYYRNYAPEGFHIGERGGKYFKPGEEEAGGPEVEIVAPMGKDSGKEFCPDCGEDISKQRMCTGGGVTHHQTAEQLKGPGPSSVEHGGQIRTNMFAPGSAGSNLVSTFGSGALDSNITGGGLTRESFAGGAAEAAEWYGDADDDEADRDTDKEQESVQSSDERKPNVPKETKVPKRIKEQQDQHRNLDYSEIDEGRVEKQSNEGGLGIDDPEAPNDGTMASSQHYRRVKEDEENKKVSLAMKAYANDGRRHENGS